LPDFEISPVVIDKADQTRDAASLRRHRSRLLDIGTRRRIGNNEAIDCGTVEPVGMSGRASSIRRALADPVSVSAFSPSS
jgi:hypothetical protein